MVPTVDTKALLSKLSDQAWVKAFVNCKRHDFRVALVRNYNTQTQEEEAVMQWLINHLDPPRPSAARLDMVRAELAMEEAKGWPDPTHNTDTQEGEKYWHETIDDAEKADAITMEQAMLDSYVEIKKNLPDIEFPDIKPKLTNVMPPAEEVKPEPPVAPATAPVKQAPVQDGPLKLEMVPGFSEIVVEKFKKAGIMDVDKLFALTYKQAHAIAGSDLVLRNIADKFTKESNI